MITTNLTITSSTILAFLIVILAVVLDFLVTKSAVAFMFAVPTAAALTLGKQKMDEMKARRSE